MNYGQRLVQPVYLARGHPPHGLQELLETRRAHRGGRAVFHQDIPAEEEDYSIFQYYISPTYDFIQEILSHGYEVEVVSPSHLKGYIRWQAETIASR